jgi:hypothetical protein
MSDSVFHHRWVTGAVGDEQAIVFLARKPREIVVPRDLQNFDTPSDETSQLVVLETDIDCDNANRAAGGMLEGGGWIR